MAEEEWIERVEKAKKASVQFMYCFISYNYKQLIFNIMPFIETMLY